ncbi:unnamed protein product, partial [Musa acuminata subsp. burmannicoides]
PYTAACPTFILYLLVVDSDPALEVDIVSAVEREGNAECVDPTPTTMLEEEPIDARVKVIGGCNEGVGGEVKADRVGLAVALNAAPPRRG